MTETIRYPHLIFKKNWNLNKKCLILLGETYSLLKAISNTPILPSYYGELMQVALNKGAQSTTAIEGNNLSDDQIANLVEGKKLPESIEYQGVEVKNILAAFNAVFHETSVENNEQLITPDLLKRFHLMVGAGLGEHFSAIPGEFRTSNVVVGRYRCPDYSDVPNLIDLYCEFLRTEFKFELQRDYDEEVFIDTFLEAIVAHVYLEWIHPFGDGNGRTGRLIEFYILSRGGNPNITLHALSNHYNLTRTEYYRQLDKASVDGDLSDFIEYALVGYRDGLSNILSKIQQSQRQITWQKYVYDQFDSLEVGQKEVFNRKRSFALEIPIDKVFRFEEIPELNIKLAKLYSNVSEKTLERDINELISLEILIKEGLYYFANISALNRMMAKSKTHVRKVENGKKM